MELASIQTRHSLENKNHVTQHLNNSQLSNNKIGIISDDLKIIIRTQNKFRSALLDSGAKISVITTKLIKQIMPYRLRDIRPLHNPVVIVSVTNDRRKILGKLDVPFYIGKTLFTHSFSVIEELSEDMILGRDFLFKFNCRLDFPSKTLMANSDHRVLALTTAVIMPNSSKTVQVKVSRNHVEPRNRKQNYVIAPTIMKTNRLQADQK